MLTLSAKQERRSLRTHGLQVQRIGQSMLPVLAPSIEIALDECFQTPGYASEVFDSMTSATDPIIWIARDGEGTVIAFLGGYLIETGRASHALRIPSPQLPARLVDADRVGAVGVIETICVRPRWQRQGLGVRLIRLAEQDLADQSADVIAIPGWKVGERVNIARAATRCGYTHELTVAGLWATECDACVYACCERTDRCVCEAAFYMKSLEG